MQSVEPNSASEKAGLKVGQLITHVNNRPVLGLLHTDLVKLILSGGKRLLLRTSHLSDSRIRLTPSVEGGVGKRTMGVDQVRYRKEGKERRRRLSLFKRLSNKKVEQLILSPISSSNKQHVRSPLFTNYATPSPPTQSSKNSITFAKSLPTFNFINEFPADKNKSSKPSNTFSHHSSTSPHPLFDSFDLSSGSSPSSPCSFFYPIKNNDTNLGSRPSSLYGLKNGSNKLKEVKKEGLQHAPHLSHRLRHQSIFQPPLQRHLSMNVSWFLFFCCFISSILFFVKIEHYLMFWWNDLYIFSMFLYRPFLLDLSLKSNNKCKAFFNFHQKLKL